MDRTRVEIGSCLRDACIQNTWVDMAVPHLPFVSQSFSAIQFAICLRAKCVCVSQGPGGNMNKPGVKKCLAPRAPLNSGLTTATIMAVSAAAAAGSARQAGCFQRPSL